MSPVSDLQARAAGTAALEPRGFRLTCSAIPREIFDALGMESARMIPPGSVASESRGEALSGAGTCAWCKSGLGSGEADRRWIGAATCDMMRRVLEMTGKDPDRRPLIIHAPKTRSPEAEEYFVAEVRWLAGELEKEAGRRLEPGDLRTAIAARNRIRAAIRALRPGLSASDLSRLIYLEARLPAGEMEAALTTFGAPDFAPSGIPALLAGSPLTPADRPWLEELDRIGLPIVADATCTGDRAVDFTVEIPPGRDPLEALARAYFRRPPCLFVRPNDDFYAYAGDLARRRRAKAAIWRSFRGCDIHSLEAPRAERRLGLPLLALDVSCGEAASVRVRTRVEAFLEGLG